MEINIENSKLERIKSVLKNSEFNTVDDFINHSIELLLFAEENKDKFKDLVSNS
ncbi:MAG: hypothetical protein VW079_01160 [Candidatus Woesearchaeota archaeon]|jgi:hypothetical protein